MEQTGQPSFAIRPMGVGEVIDAGIRLARANYRLLVTVMAWGVVPAFVLGVIANAAGYSGQAASLVDQAPAVIALFVVLEIAIVLVSAVAGLALILACARLIEGRVGPEDLRVGVLYAVAFRRLGWLILLSLIAIVLFTPLVILFPLGIFLYVRWCIALAVLVVEGQGPIGSLRRSWGLTKGSWWHVVGVGVVALILVGVLEYVIALLFIVIGGILTFTGSRFAGGVVTTLGSSLVELLVSPFSAAIYTVLYYELRARREGFDLEMRARQL